MHDGSLDLAPEPDILLSLLDGVTDSLSMYDREWRILYVNGRAEEVSGRRREELIGRNVWEVFPDAVSTRFYEEFHRAVAEMTPVLFEETFFGRWFETRAYPSPDGLIVSSRDVTERKLGEAALREREERFRLALASGQVGTWDFDPQTGALTWDAKTRELFGLPEGAEVTYETFLAGLHPEDRGRADRAVALALDPASGGEFDIEYRTVGLSDGVERWVAAWGRGFFDAEGRPVRFIGTVRNISGRKRAEVERDASEARFREEAHTLESVQRITSTIAGDVDLTRIVQTITDEATELTGAQFGSFFYNVLSEAGESYTLYTLSGVPREAFEGFPMPRNTKVFAPTFRGEGVVRIDDVTQDPRYGQNPPYHGMPKGHLPVRSYLAVPVVTRAGEVAGGLFFGHPDPGVFTASHERILVGVAEQAAIAIERARLFEASERERRAAEQARVQAEEASRAKDEFLAMVSHELRTPLNSMLGWMRLLRSGRLDAATSERGLDTIERNVKSQAQLIEDLLDVSRIVTGKLRLDVQPVEVAAAVEAAIDSVRLAAEARHVRLEAVLDPAAGPVSGDPERLQQVVWNLLSNAVKFTPKGGKVQVRLARVDSHVEIVVADTGQGIKPEFLPYVFERFRQADAGIARAFGGLGLGLAIVRHLVELHGGSVKAESAGENMGTTFTVRLPLMPLQRAPEEARGPAERGPASGSLGFECPPELTGIKVLVVDDQADTREMLQVVLDSCGALVRTAGSAAEAIEALDAWQPDILVSDIGMPGEDGYDLIRKVRARDAGGGGTIPAVALTAYARYEDRMRALEAGFQMHVAKPVEPAELVMVIHSLLQFRSTL